MGTTKMCRGVFIDGAAGGPAARGNKTDVSKLGLAKAVSAAAG